MDAGTAKGMIYDLMVEVNALRAELRLMTKYRDHYAAISASYYCEGINDEADELYRTDIGEPSE